SEFLDVPGLDFSFEFSLRAQTCHLTDASDVEAFIGWTCRACMGEDLDRPEVWFGYQLDHYLNDCARLDWARDLVTKELPALQKQLAPVPEAVVQLIRRSKSRRQSDGTPAG